MTTIIKSNNLHEVMTTIEKNEGGSWPTALFIQNKMLNDYKPPFVITNNKGRPLTLGAYYIDKPNRLESVRREEFTIVYDFNSIRVA